MTYTEMGESLTIFKDGEWEIQRINKGEYGFITIDSIIVHYCTRKVRSLNKWDEGPRTIVSKTSLTRPCTYCGHVAPEGLQALWLLQNMEHI